METSQITASEERITALEQKFTNMDALVKGLLAELLDFRAVTMTMSRETEEHNRQELKRGPVVWGTSSPVPVDPSALPSVAASSDGSTMIRPRGTRQSDVPVAPKEPEMVRIMQSDGTMKLEPRYGDAKHIDSSAGYGRNRKDTSGKSKQNPLIYAAEQDKPDRAKV